jgi:hypothetical protein
MCKKGQKYSFVGRLQRIISIEVHTESDLTLRLDYRRYLYRGLSSSELGHLELMVEPVIERRAWEPLHPHELLRLVQRR